MPGRGSNPGQSALKASALPIEITCLNVGILILHQNTILADLLRFVKRIMFIFVLILLKPSKSNIFCDDYYPEALDHSIISDYPINKFKVHFVQYQYTLMWVGIELYSKVGKCLQLNCCPLLSLILYLLFQGAFFKSLFS